MTVPPCPDCDAANARAREMHRRAQTSEAEVARLRAALDLTESALAMARTSRGLALADRQRAEHERDRARAELRDILAMVAEVGGER